MPRTAMIDETGLARLLAWLSPAFPVGAYSYSHGLEYAVEAGALRDRSSVERWIDTILAHGAGRIDAALFLEAHRAVRGDDVARLSDVLELAAAMRGSGETALEARAQGSAFVGALANAWSDAALSPWLEALGPSPSYAVAVATAAAAIGIDAAPALTAYLHAFAANLVSAAVRLVPLGQTDGQRITAALVGRLPALVAAAQRRPFAEIGGSALVVDWTSMLHETQSTRLFRS